MGQDTRADAERAGSIDEIVALFEVFGRDPYDEELAQLDHALQTAALAEREGADEALVAAALLHDVGHLLALRDAAAAGGRARPAPVDLHHEAVGARWLGSLFGPEVTGPVALHVRAKRYLAARDATYQGSLSAGSTRSLAMQGGPLDRDEADAFEANPGWQAAVALRRWDDAGKVIGLEVAPLAQWRPLLDRLTAR